MASFASRILPCLSVMIGIYAIQEAFYLKIPSLQNQTCTSNAATWSFPNIPSKIRCTRACSVLPLCKSIFYNPTTKACVGLASFPRDVNQCVPDDGTQMYSLAVGLVNDTCNTDLDCNVDLECTNDTCQCVTGLSAIPALRTCVENCTEYGTTFWEYPELILTGTYITNTLSLSLLECYHLCIAETNVMCVGVTYDYTDGDCFTESLSPYTTTYSLDGGVNISYYKRNCA